MDISDITSKVKSSTRAIPTIYAYTTPGYAPHDGWTKIGYTEQDAGSRIKQQTYTADIETRLEWQGNAIYEDGTGDTFRDTDFHNYLVKLGYEKKPSKEWVRITPDDSHRKFFDFRINRGMLEAHSAVSYALRAEQERASEVTADYARLHENAEFLWNAKPRFGKTLTAYDLCKRLGARTVLIVTNRPAIANSWYDDYVKFLGIESGYHFVSSAGSIAKHAFVKSREEYLAYMRNNPDGAKNCITFVSLQDLKGAERFGGGYPKLEWIADINWDILIIDEAHEGVDTFKTDVAFDQIKRKFTLHLSGTPFKALANEKFPEKAIFNWTYADEQQAKRDWDDDDERNPYADLPQLNMFTYRMSDIISDEVEAGLEIDGETVEYAFDLNEFFSTKENGCFAYNDDVDCFLDALTTQKKFPFSTPELRDELRHTFWMLDRVESARALARKLKAHPVFKEYEIVLAAGDGRIDDGEEIQKSFDKVRDAIAKHDRTITLSVGQLTTGVTIPEWTAVLVLSNMKSPALYMQAAFRAQNPCLFYRDGVYLRKENAYVFDFDPARTLMIFEQFANDLYSDTAAAAGDMDTRKRRILTLLNFFPVYGEDSDGEMEELDAEKILSIPRKIRSQEVVRRGFMSDFLFQNISNVFHAPAQVLEIIESFQPFKAPDKDLGITAGETARELDLDGDGNVSIPDEQVVGLASDLFGDKVYGEVEGALSYAIVSIIDEGVEEDDDERMLKNLERVFADDVTAPLVAAAQENYGSALGASQRKRVERKIKANADIALNREIGNYRIERTMIERERADKIAEASSDQEIDVINADMDRKRKEAAADLKKSLESKKGELIQSAGAEIVREVETAKKEERKRTIECTIRDHLRGFSRTIPSFLMAYGDDDLCLANFDDYTEDEVFFDVTGITEDNFRFLRDGGDYIDEETGEERHFDGNLFDPVVFDDSVKEFMHLRRELANYFDESHAEDIFNYIPPQKTSQIFTPRSVVKLMVDKLEEENPGCYDDPDATFADLYMKSGLYITEIVKRLFASAGLKAAYPDENDRIRHILTEQVYGMAPIRIIYLIATNYILGFDEDLKIETENFVQADAAAAAKAGTLAKMVDDTFGRRAPSQRKQTERAALLADAGSMKKATPVSAHAPTGDWIIDAAIEAGLDYVDKRPNGGSLWIIGGRSLNDFMTGMQARGASFRYREGGGKATKGKDAWWLK